MKTKKIFNFVLAPVLILVAMFSSVAHSSTSIGTVAGNLFGVGMSIREVVRTVCIIAGSGLILASLIQYKKHRQNPIEATWGTIIFTFVSGVAIICLTFIPISV